MLRQLRGPAAGAGHRRRPRRHCDPDLPLAALAAELREPSTRLDALDAGELAVNLRAVLSCSCRALPPAAARVFAAARPARRARTSACPRRPSLAGPARRPGPRAPARTRRRAPGAGTRAGPLPHARPGPALRRRAGRRATRRADAAGRVRRLLDHYLHTAYAAALLLAPAPRPRSPRSGRARASTPRTSPTWTQALAWFTAEHPRPARRRRRAPPTAGFDTHAWQLAWSARQLPDRRGHWHDRCHRSDARARRQPRRAGRPAGQAHAHRGLASAYAMAAGRTTSAHDPPRRRRSSLFGDLGDRGRAGARPPRPRRVLAAAGPLRRGARPRPAGSRPVPHRRADRPGKPTR